MVHKAVMLSVIVPIYNGKGTLVRCIESILEQREIVLEVICVDDESTDESRLICKGIAAKDNRVRVIEKKNGGVASARNAGLKSAKGKYITFIDQDDWIEKDAYKIMIDAAIGEDLDMVVCNYSKDYENEIQPMVNRQIIPEKIQKRDELIRYAFFREEYRGFAAFVWNKIVKKEFLDKQHIKFDSSLRRGDDVLFFSNIALAEPKTVYINKCFYHYVQRKDSITHTLTKNNMGRLSEILIGYKRSLDILEKYGVSVETLGFMKCFYTYHASVLYELAIEQDMKKESKIYKQAMNQYLLEYKKQNKNNKDRIDRICRLMENEYC